MLIFIFSHQMFLPTSPELSQVPELSEIGLNGSPEKLHGFSDEDVHKLVKPMSEVGFEPTPTFVDQNALPCLSQEGYLP